jgi:hydrogenase expression/formation protein HypC
MCIGIPMRVLEASSGAALVSGRGRRETIDTRLVGDCEAGEWLLVFMQAARERLDADRTREINAALDLLEGGLAGHHDEHDPADPGFVLPSSLSHAQLVALTGGPTLPSNPATAPHAPEPSR